MGSAGSEEEEDDVRARLWDGCCSSSSSSWEDDGAGEGNDVGVEWEKRLGSINVVVEDIIDSLV